MLEFGVISVSLMLVGIALLWRTQRFRNSEIQAGDKFLSKASETNRDGAQLARDVNTYAPRPGKKSRAETNLDRREATVEKNIGDHKLKISTLKGTPYAHLEDAGKALGDVSNHVAEAQNTVAIRDQLEAKMRESLRVLQAAGRIDKKGNILDDTGLPPEFNYLFTSSMKNWSRVANSDFSQNQPEILQDHLEQAIEFRRQVEELAPLQNITSVHDNEIATTAESVQSTQAHPPSPPISVERAVKSAGELDHGSPRPPGADVHTRNQGPGLT